MIMIILRKIRYSWKMLTTVFTCFFGISLFFICSSVPQNFIAHFLHVDPSYTGGLICADFFNSSDADFPLLRYTVYQPVTNARWQKSAEYWQLAMEFKDNSTAFPNITVFIDADNIDGAGNNKTAGCDFELKISDSEAKLYDGTGSFLCNTEYYKLNEGQQIKIRIPLQDKRIQKILVSKKTKHSISVNTFSPLSLEASMTPYKKTKEQKEKDKAYINYVKKFYEESQTIQMSPGKSTDENLAFYKEKINYNPEDYVSLACYGSWLAVKGGESSVMKAVSLVNEAYTYLDKAAAFAARREGEIEVLLNRASVSASVPEQVFGKAAAGAEDFMRIVSLTEDQALKAYCYVMAYECYQKCGKETQAILALQEAQKMVQYQ